MNIFKYIPLTWKKPQYRTFYLAFSFFFLSLVYMKQKGMKSNLLDKNGFFWERWEFLAMYQ